MGGFEAAGGRCEEVALRAFLQKQIPFGNDRKKSKHKGKSEDKDKSSLRFGQDDNHKDWENRECGLR
jgi:hypothetical protein